MSCRSPLWSIQAGHLPVIKLLLLFGADPNIVAAGEKARDLAKHSGNGNAATYLVETETWSPMHIAVSAGLLDEARVALHLGLLDVHPYSLWLGLFLPSLSQRPSALKALVRSRGGLQSMRMGRGWAFGRWLQPL